MAVNLFVMDHELVWEDPDIYVVRVPFTHFGLGHTNCYLIRSGSDVLAIDPGTALPRSRQALARAAAEEGIDLGHARFLCTHLHFDHAALLKDLAHPGMHVLMGKTAYTCNPWNNYQRRKALLRSMLWKEGVPPSGVKGVAAYMSESRVCDLPGCSYELLVEGDLVHVGTHALRVIETPGHSRGHICLFEEEQGILFTGDHVLEEITPGLAMPFEGDDSVADYLQSLAKLETLRIRAVLPGHGEAFYGFAGRAAALREHHAMRLGQVYEVVAYNPGANGYEVMQAVPWKRSGPISDWNMISLQLRLSMSAQTFAYLEYLLRIGELERSEDSAGRHYRIA